MSKRILALALFAVMVLSMVPLAQAVSRTQNVVYQMDLINQVQNRNQGLTGGPARAINGVTYPSSADTGTTATGDQTKVNNFSSDWNTLTVTSAFADLHKRAQPYNTTNIARYDVFVKLAIVDVTVPAATDPVTFTFPGITNDVVATATNANTFANNLGFLAPSGALNANVLDAKAYLDFAAITVNGTVLSTDFLTVSYLGVETDGVNVGGNLTYNLFYYLKVGEFDVNDAASLSADYTVIHKTISGTNTTKVRAAFANQGESDKPIKPLYLKPVRKGVVGVYNVYTVNGVVFIDYAHDIGGADYVYKNFSGGVYQNEDVYVAIPMGFKFYEDAAATVRVPASGKYAYVVPGNDDTPVSENNSRFFVSIGDGSNYAGLPTGRPANVASGSTASGHQNGLAGPYQIRYIGYANSFDNRDGVDAPFTIPPASLKAAAGRVTNGDDKNLGVWLPNRYGRGVGTAITLATSLDTDDERTGISGTFADSTNRTMKVAIEDEHYRYRTGDIKVVFRPLARNLITTAVIVERYLTIAVGEKVELTIESASATTFSNITLKEVSSVKSHVYIDGMAITGLSVGTSQIQVTASGKVIDQITVNVVATTEVTTPVTPAVAQWRVLARKLNIRSGPGTNYGKVGTLAMNQIVAGEDLGNGWVQVGANQFVSKQYVVPVSGSATGIGNYTVNASSLNVRSGPGSSYAKTGSLTRGTVVEIIAIQNGWAQLANGGWVSTLYLI